MNTLITAVGWICLVILVLRIVTDFLIQGSLYNLWLDMADSVRRKGRSSKKAASPNVDTNNERPGGE